MEYRDKILQLAYSGPLLPNTVAKALSTNGILAGAMLSEMVAKGLLKTSTLKIGGSPLYYVPGKEEQLLAHATHLNEKDKRTLALLQEHKVLREKDCDPLVRVSLSLIKDFSKPLTVEHEEGQETFYKYFLCSDAEAKEIIKANLESRTKEQSEQTEKIEQKEIKKEEPKEITKEVIETKEPPLFWQTEPKENKETTKAHKKEKITLFPTGDFWERLMSYFSENKITIKEQTVIKKKTDFDILLEIPSPVGKLTYYCKAKAKKKLTEADISSAYVGGQIKKLPTIFITNGEFTKKAKELAEQLKGLTITQLPWASTSKTSSSENQ